MQIPLKLFNKVLDYFDGNVTRARLWFDIPNPVLGGLKPKDYHQKGSFKNLDKLIIDALKEYHESQSTTTTSN